MIKCQAHILRKFEPTFDTENSTKELEHDGIKISYFFFDWSTLPLRICLGGLLQVRIIFS